MVSMGSADYSGGPGGVALKVGKAVLHFHADSFTRILRGQNPAFYNIRNINLVKNISALFLNSLRCLFSGQILISLFHYLNNLREAKIN